MAGIVPVVPNPLVSVLMTAYNREKYIAAAIGSVMASTYDNLELIIVDDDSKDETAAVARRYASADSRIGVYINEKNLGDYPNRNRAASYARGKYLKYLDSDDMMYPHCLEVMVSSMEKYPDAAVGLCSVPDKDHPCPVCLSPREVYFEHFNGYGHFDRAPGSAIIKRSSFEAVGGFTGERMIGDYQLWIKLGMKNPFVKMPRDLIWDRMHAGQESQSKYAENYKRLKWEIMEDALRHADCPLTEEEAKAILRSVKHSDLKGKIKGFIRSFKTDSI